MGTYSLWFPWNAATKYLRLCSMEAFDSSQNELTQNKTKNNTQFSVHNSSYAIGTSA